MIGCDQKLKVENHVFDQSRKDEPKNKPTMQPASGTVSTFYARGLLDYLQYIDLNPNVIFDAAFIAELNDSGSRIPISRWQMMFERAIAYTGDSELPMKVAAQLRPQHLGMLGFAIMSSRTLADVVAILLRFEQLVDDVNTTHLVENGDDIELHWLPLLGPSLPFFMQQSLVCWAVIARQVTAQPTIICDVHFRFEAPQNIDIYQRIFGGNIYFNASVTKLVFHKSVLALPITLCDPATNSLLMTQVEKQLQSLTQPDFVQQLRAHLLANLASNQVSITDVAAAFEISPRTLQYQLNNYGLGYRSLLEQIRQERAEHYLRTTDLSLHEIAFLLGYSEQSPFQNAFRRWTGESPGCFRKNAER